MPTDNVPHDTEAEEIILGAIFLSPERVADLAQTLEPLDFYTPRNQRLWAAWEKVWHETGQRPDQLTLAREAGVDFDVVMQMAANTIGFNERHVETLKRHRVARDIMSVCFDARARAGQREDPYEIAGELDHFVSSIGETNGAAGPEAITLWEMSERTSANAPEIVPGCLKLDWRALVTGEEGSGKGTLLRTFALTTAAGYHPFTHLPIEPHRTLMVDLENPDDAILETGLPLVETLVQRSLRDGQDYDDTACKFWHRPGGIDIRDRHDRADLIREIAAHRPELVCVGPWYKLSRPKSHESYEESAMATLAILDDLRTKYGFALMVEAHSPKATNGQRRSLVPHGSVFLTAWPELGIGLRKDENNPTILHVEHWRGARLRQQWPQHVFRDPSWIVSGQWDYGRMPGA